MRWKSTPTSDICFQLSCCTASFTFCQTLLHHRWRRLLIQTNWKRPEFAHFFPFGSLSGAGTILEDRWASGRLSVRLGARVWRPFKPLWVLTYLQMKTSDPWGDFDNIRPWSPAWVMVELNAANVSSRTLKAFLGRVLNSLDTFQNRASNRRSGSVGTGPETSGAKPAVLRKGWLLKLRHPPSTIHHPPIQVSQPSSDPFHALMHTLRLTYTLRVLINTHTWPLTVRVHTFQDVSAAINHRHYTLMCRCAFSHH